MLVLQGWLPDEARVLYGATADEESGGPIRWPYVSARDLPDPLGADIRELIDVGEGPTWDSNDRTA